MCKHKVNDEWFLTEKENELGGTLRHDKMPQQQGDPVKKITANYFLMRKPSNAEEWITRNGHRSEMR